MVMYRIDLKVVTRFNDKMYVSRFITLRTKSEKMRVKTLLRGHESWFATTTYK